MDEQRQVPQEEIETTGVHAMQYLPGHDANESIWKRKK